MKIIALLIALLSATFCSGQTNDKFKSGVELIENKIVVDLQKPTSILFVYEDHTHHISHYLNLSKKLKRAFKNSEVEIGFKYQLNSDDPLKSELKLIPEKPINESNFKYVCKITTADFYFWDNNLNNTRKRKQDHNLIFELVNKKTNELIETGKINIKTYYTISTENKKLSNLLYDLLVG